MGDLNSVDQEEEFVAPLTLHGLGVTTVDEAEELVDEMVLRFAPDPLSDYQALRLQYGHFAPGFAGVFGEDPKQQSPVTFLFPNATP